jgi:hypothetical protein
MDPSEALSAGAQVAVALAGFAGVVVVFRSSAVHEWSALDKFRLRVLLTDSVVPLVLSLIGLVLVSTGLPPNIIWRWCSAGTTLVLIAIGFFYSGVFKRFSATEVRSVGGTRSTFYVTGTVGGGVTLLQIYNAIVLTAFWPFFVAIVALIFGATVQFVRMITLYGQSSP